MSDTDSMRVRSMLLGIHPAILFKGGLEAAAVRSRGPESIDFLVFVSFFAASGPCLKWFDGLLS
jgi:hypothetical protein